MQTLTQALYAARVQDSNINRGLAGFVGKPVAASAETQQAYTNLLDLLPARGQRDYTADQLLDAAMRESSSGRWEFRPR